MTSARGTVLAMTTIATPVRQGSRSTKTTTATDTVKATTDTGTTRETTTSPRALARACRLVALQVHGLLFTGRLQKWSASSSRAATKMADMRAAATVDGEDPEQLG